jgi:hypothetical protein
MKQSTFTDQLLRRYLLGELSEDERARFQDNYFADNDLFEELLVVEEELIDDYVRGGLSAKERQQFVERFMSTAEGRERIEFSRVLKKAAGTQTQTASEVRRQSFWQSASTWLAGAGVGMPFSTRAIQGAQRVQYAMAAVMAVLLIAGAWLVVQNNRLHNRLDQVATGLRQENEKLQRDLADERQRNQALGEKVGDLGNQLSQTQELNRQIAGFLTPQPIKEVSGQLDPITFDPARGITGKDLPTGKALVIPAGTDLLTLKLRLSADEYRSYRVVVRTRDKQDVWSQDSLRPHRSNAGSQLVLRIPAKQLKTEAYLAVVSGASSEGEYIGVSSYAFRVTR